MAIEYVFNATTLTLSANIVENLSKFTQKIKYFPESGGLLIGRTDINGNTTIIELTTPMEGDIKHRYGFKRIDKRHLEVVKQANQRCLYYKGNWHTHPHECPNPSCTDMLSWRDAINKSKPGNSEYIFFLIVGINSIRVWCGDMRTKIISEMTINRKDH